MREPLPSEDNCNVCVRLRTRSRLNAGTVYLEAFDNVADALDHLEDTDDTLLDAWLWPRDTPNIPPVQIDLEPALEDRQREAALWTRHRTAKRS